MNKQSRFLILSVLTLVPVLAFAIPRAQRPKTVSIKHNVIYNGSPVAATGSSWKSVVQIRLGTSGCTGTIVSERSILTAAHCVLDGGDSLGVYFFHGSEYSRWDYYEKGEFLVSRLDYQINTYDRGKSDMAVITVNKPLEDDEHTRMYTVTSENLAAIEVGSPVYMIGAGTVGYLKDADGLRFSKGKIQSYTEKMVWVTGNGRTGICGGDSGGPLTIQVNGEHLLLGVLAQYHMDVDDRAGDTCTPGGGYAFMTAKKYDWFHEKIRAHEAALEMIRPEPTPAPTPIPTPVPVATPTPTPLPAETTATQSGAL